MSDSQRNPDELGALWEKTSARGSYFTGTINGQAVVVFKNDRKAPGSKAPDWRVLKAKPKDGPSASRETQAERFDADDSGW